MKRILSSIALVTGLTFTAMPAEATYGYHHGYHHGYYGGGGGVSISIGTGPTYYHSYPAYAARCRWVPGHWFRGYWYPATKVCDGGGYYYRESRCEWVGGHWWNGVWYPGQRRCW